MKTLGFWFMCLAISLVASAEEPLWLELPAGNGPGQSKKIVLISGDEEYRSEEALPQLAKILSTHHGFHCTVLFAIDPQTGYIDPNRRDNIPGLEKLATADLMILAVRFRSLPDEQMRHIVEYVESGRPVIGLRTATHAFDLKPPSRYAHWSWNSSQWEGGFGRQVLGETWISHHGRHGVEGTRGILAPGAKDHPILRGIRDGDIFGVTDVYTVRLPLLGDAQPLVLGQVVQGLDPNDPPVSGPKNNPMMPIAWTKTYTTSSGKSARVFTTTMGASQDLLSEGFRRLLVNAVYWAVGLEDQIPERAHVELVGDYQPSPYKFNGFRKNLRPSDYR